MQIDPLDARRGGRAGARGTSPVRKRRSRALDGLLAAFLAQSPRSVAAPAGVIGGELYAGFQRRLDGALAGAADAAAREERVVGLLRDLHEFARTYDGDAFPRPPPGRPPQLARAMSEIGE